MAKLEGAEKTTGRAPRGRGAAATGATGRCFTRRAGAAAAMRVTDLSAGTGARALSRAGGGTPRAPWGRGARRSPRSREALVEEVLRGALLEQALHQHEGDAGPRDAGPGDPEDGLTLLTRHRAVGPRDVHERHEVEDLDLVADEPELLDLAGEREVARRLLEVAGGLAELLAQLLAQLLVLLAEVGVFLIGRRLHGGRTLPGACRMSIGARELRGPGQTALVAASPVRRASWPQAASMSSPRGVRT
jgi:hypothetical protein